MSYKKPTSRIKKKKDEGINLIPILDSVFIFIFFLLMSAQFIKIYEIGSDVPMVSNEPPPKNQKKPLALTLTIKDASLVLAQGIPSVTVKTFGKIADGSYDLLALHDYLINVKKNHMDEETIILEPLIDISYEEIVKIMDAVRLLKKTDESLFTKDKDGIDTKLNTLFHKIVFGNIMS